MLNFIWLAFFVIAFIVGVIQVSFLNRPDIFSAMMQAVFEMSQLAFEVSLGLVGIMAFWMGIMRVGEQGGLLDLLTRGLRPLLVRLFPQVPPGHPAFGAMVMNMAANILGMDNAASPLGLKAMKELQTLNSSNHDASDAQVLFLVLNTSSVTLFPITIFMYRAQQGAMDPTDVFIPILCATFASTLVGLLATAYVQNLHLRDPVVMAYLGGGCVLVVGLIFWFSSLDEQALRDQSARISNFILFALIAGFLLGAAKRKVNAFDAFIEGAGEGIRVVIKIVPYLVAMLVGIGVFRASGALDLLLDFIRRGVASLGVDGRFVDALPTAFMKPLSGSGARGMMVETMNTLGADSFAGRLASIMQGSTETTLYVVALYLGSVGIRNPRHAIACGLLADFAGILTAIAVAYLFFG